MLLAQDVLHAYTMISISIMVVFTSLTGQRETERVTFVGRTGSKCLMVCVRAVLLGHRLDHKDIFASHRLLDLHPCFYGNETGCEDERSRTYT